MLKDEDIDDEWKEQKTYRNLIDKIPGVRELISTPFILSMLVKVIPHLAKKMSSQKQLRLLTIDLYKEFVSQWIEKEMEKQVGIVSANTVHLTYDEYFEYAVNLAQNMMGNDKTAVDAKDSRWKRFFDPHNQVIAQTLCGIPLSKIGNTYSFIHKSILEFFAV